MGYIYFGVPRDLLILFKKETQYDNFVETGTFMGNTIFWASTVFANCFTIEISKELSVNASKRTDCPKNIEFIVGDSKQELNKLIPRLTDKTIFWLDGHYSGEGTGGSEDECPIMAELDSIKELQNSIILIDDARFFIGPPPAGHRTSDWPGLDDIFVKLKSNFPNHYVTLIDDTIISCPKKYKYILDQDWKNNFTVRYPKIVEDSRFKTLIKKVFS